MYQKRRKCCTGYNSIIYDICLDMLVILKSILV